jgi:pimeloyl-ACP methyl ester carboxylesterase
MVNPPQIPDWLAELYPFQPQSFTTAGGARMSYLDEGPRHDEAVLMLHGNPTWSFYYRNLVRELAPTMRCVVPDHIGMGLSDKPASYDYSLATRIADIEALVERLGLKKVHLVVHDWGGAIGFGWAGRHPEMVGRIVITNTAAFASKRIPLRIALCRFPGLGPWAVRALNAFAGPATWMAMSRRKLTPAERDGYLFPYRTATERVAVAAFVQDIPLERSHRSWKTLHEVEKNLKHFRDHRVCVIWGARDFCFNDSFFNRWKKIFPQAEFSWIDDAGHYVLEDGGDDALGLAEGFLQAP